MEDKKLEKVLFLHKRYLSGESEGVRADFRYEELYCADFQRADLRDANFRTAYIQGANFQGANLRDATLWRANLRDANLRHAELRGADLRGANLRDADLRNANIDFAVWPLWCGSLEAYIDDRIAIQLLYHLLRPVQASPYVSQEIKGRLLTDDLIDLANRFHRTSECGEIER